MTKSGAELVNPYGSETAKGVQVKEMFDSIAPAYDFMNTAMTLGLHKWWRNCALTVAGRLLPKDRHLSLLDIATGTGDVAFELGRRYPDSEILGIDLSTGMLKIAEAKYEKLKSDISARIEFAAGDSLSLTLDDNSCDMITVAYGVRNFEQLRVGLQEMCRVLNSGGVLCVIELSQPRSPLSRLLYNFYSKRLIPSIGRMVSGDSRAYTYLPESIAAAPQREELCRILKECGFRDCSWHSLTFGAVTYYIARK